MVLSRRTTIAATAIAALAAAAWRLAPADATAAAPAAAHADKPYRLEVIAGSPVKRVVLTAKAAQRLDIQTGLMTRTAAGGLVAPYQALFYDLKGEPWVYTVAAPLSFVRHKVTVASIAGALVHLVDGPADGTVVVTVGVAQLYGTERGVGH